MIQVSRPLYQRWKLETHEELRPCLIETLSQDGEDAEDTAEEEGATTTEPVVEWIGEPTTKEGRSNVWTAQQMSQWYSQGDCIVHSP